jgi:response regulator RpfG family c-di-GMP phosphodiesterase
MKKILLIDQDQKFIAGFQTKLVYRYEILATENYDTAYRLIKMLPIDLVLARLPPPNFKNQIIQLKKLLKKLQHKKFENITRILTVPEENDYQVNEFLKLGIAAVVVNVDEAAKWMN